MWWNVTCVKHRCERHSLFSFHRTKDLVFSNWTIGREVESIKIEIDTSFCFVWLVVGYKKGTVAG